MEDCIITTYALSQGYGGAWFNGKQITHQRLVYCTSRGISPSEISGLVVMHICDNRACVNPAHLQLGTYKDNTADMIAKGRDARPKGETHTGSKLTAAQVLQIREELGTTREVASKYGINCKTVSRIRLRQTWKHLP